MSGAHILLVDDDPAIIRAVSRALEGQSYRVTALECGGPVQQTVQETHPDVVLLDLMLPDADGIEVCRAIRRISAVPVIVLSAVGDDRKKVQALDEGADDYVTKPFSLDELQARIRVALRRQTGTASTILVAGPISLDLARRQVTVNGAIVHLTPKEFDLLRLLLQHQGRVLTQRFILGQVWGPEYVDDSHILRTFIYQLRSKLGAFSAEANTLIVTDPSVGYRIDPPQS